MRVGVRVAAVLASAMAFCANASAATPTVTEFGSGLDFLDAPTGITAGPDGNLWFTNNLSDEIGRITPGGTITEFQLPSATASPRDIVAGADGNLWFTESGVDNKIGKMTTAGVLLDEYTVPTAGSQPTGITAGPSGTLWFTEKGPDKVGQVTTGGSFQGEFALPGGADPTDIVFGSDGAFFVTEPGIDKIARVTTPGGVVTQVSGTNITAGAEPTAIAAGPDDNLWFTEPGLDQIGRMSPLGTVTEFPLPTGSQPSDIVAGPDGNLWFTEPGTNKIGRITPTGAISHFDAGLSPAANPLGITAGADGNLWFAEDSDRIGRITTALDPPAFENPAPIQITGGAASTYPSFIDVGGLDGPIVDVNVRITGFSHSWPDDAEVLLVAPTGEKVLLMADNGGGGAGSNEIGVPATGLTFTFDDEGSVGSLGNDGPLVSGIFNPSQGSSNDGAPLAFPAPAPSFPYAPTLSTLDGQGATGTWRLFVNDDYAPADGGAIHGGWGLDIVTRGAYDDGPVQWNEDQGPGRINVLANDTGGFLQIDAITDAPHGTTAIVVDDPFEVSYAPDPNYCNEPGPAPPDSFQYTITGGDSATVEVDVVCTPDPSVATDDARTVAEDSGASSFDVVANDTDADDEPVQVTAASDPGNGTATVIQGTPDAISYAPDPNYCNDGAPPDDTFTYTVGGGDTATVAVAVTCVDEPIVLPATPNTTITKAPKKKLKAKNKVTATFEFSSSVASSSFACALDGATAKPCSSPQSYKVRKGRHTFSVAATAAGQRDLTPATFSFQVKKKKPKK